MKNIKLTKEHKSKLLEMCKVLFPEYNWHIGFKPYYEQNGESPYEENDLGYLYLLGFGYKKGIPLRLDIHWFEFCMTHLAKKIYFKNLKNYNEFEDLISDIFLYYFTKKLNPIDYLYEEFKTLTK